MTDPVRKSSGRPRIRTIKPESWQDENLGGRVGRDARLLFWVLVSLADDDGRFRALPSLIVGHGYPYDDDALTLLPRWLDELAGAGLVVLYAVDGMRYGALPGFTEHQRIDRPSPSDLPTPPARTVDDESTNGRGSVVRVSEGIKDHDQEGIGSTPRASARRERAQQQPVDHDSLPDDFPATLAPAVEAVLQTLVRVAAAKGAYVVSRAAIARVIASRPAKLHERAAADFETWAVHGPGAGRKLTDAVAAYRNWLDREPDVQRPTSSTPADGELGDPPRPPATGASSAQRAAERFPDLETASVVPLLRNAVHKLSDRNGHGPAPPIDQVCSHAARWLTADAETDPAAEAA
jgi:hypothetical protein